jgi:hypothetical protein
VFEPITRDSKTFQQRYDRAYSAEAISARQFLQYPVVFPLNIAMSSQALVQIRDVHKPFTRGSERIEV